VDCGKWDKGVSSAHGSLDYLHHILPGPTLPRSALSFVITTWHYHDPSIQLLR